VQPRVCTRLAPSPQPSAKLILRIRKDDFRYWLDAPRLASPRRNSRVGRIQQEFKMHVDRSCPETGSPDQSPSPAEAGSANPQVVDWFALTEGNAPSDSTEPAAIDTPTLQVPSAGSIGGLRP
jgi:hypothetical protein